MTRSISQPAIVHRWIGERETLSVPAQNACDLRMIGDCFFAMATYTLCPLMGVKTFALQPERMIDYGLQGEAASFSFHLLIEVVLGRFFIWLNMGAVQQALPADSRQR